MTRWIGWTIVCSLIAVSGGAQAGLVAHYQFDETGGTIAYTSVGTINGALHGGATFVPGAGIRGGAIELKETTGDFVDMGNHFSFTSGSFSLQAWVKLAPGNGGGLPIAKHWSGFANGYYLATGEVGNGCSEFGRAHFYAGYPCGGVSSIVVNDGLWHQLVGVYDSVNHVLTIYVDGQFQASTQDASPIIATAAPFRIGGMTASDGTSESYYTGLVDEVRIYNNALTDQQVRALYQTSLPVGGSLSGVIGARVTCRNVTTQQSVIIPLTGGAMAWDCEAAGLVVHPNDVIRQTVTGRR